MEAFKAQVAEWRKQREKARMNYRQLWSEYGGAFCEWWENGCTNEVRLALILTSKDDILTNSSSDENAVALLAGLMDSLFPEMNALIISSQKEEKDGEEEGKTEEVKDRDETMMVVVGNEEEKKEKATEEKESTPSVEKEKSESTTKKGDKEEEEGKGKKSDENVGTSFKMEMCEFMKLAFDRRDIETELFSIAALREAMEHESADALLVARGSLILQFCLSVMLMFTSQLNEEE